jgi:hypothetical protein
VMSAYRAGVSSSKTEWLTEAVDRLSRARGCSRPAAMPVIQQFAECGGGDPRLSDSGHRTLQARAIATAAIVCLQVANEEWVRLRGQSDMLDLHDTAIRRPI